jgi:hypothetical protein
MLDQLPEIISILSAGAVKLEHEDSDEEDEE